MTSEKDRQYAVLQSASREDQEGRYVLAVIEMYQNWNVARLTFSLRQVIRLKAGSIISIDVVVLFVDFVGQGQVV